MNERIIVLPKTNKLVLSLAYNNKSLFNVRVFTPVELAREALLRNGIICDKEFISKSQELSYYKTIIESVDYFKTSKLADIKNINQTINTIRQLVINDEDKTIKDNLIKGIFKEKNDALYEIYNKYINKLNDENKVDTIGLIRYAIENVNKKIDSEVIVLNEYPLETLELELVKKVSNNNETKSLYDLYEINKKDVHIESFKNCYGTSNEVGSIIDDIFTNNKVDQCVVACADYLTYSQIFYDYACKYNLNITFGNGLSLINSYPGKLLEQYYHWMSLGSFGFEPFLKLIYSPYFNYELLNSCIDFDNEDDDVSKFYNVVSKLRLTNNKLDNDKTISDFKNSISRKDFNNNDKLEKYVSSIEKIAGEFSLPIEDFISKYSTTRNFNEFVTYFDISAKSAIINELKTIKDIGLDITSDVIETLLKKPVYRQNNKPGHIHITSIDGALSSLRNNLYICGLSSSIYPGSPKENPLLLDDDLNDFGSLDLTSNGKIKNKRILLMNLVNLASSLDNKIYLSYPGLNVSELKNNNASSLLFEIYKMENRHDKSLKDFMNDVIKVEYFDPKLSLTRNIGISYNNGDNIEFVNKESKNNNITGTGIKSYSPSALNTFFDCRKKFFFQYVLKIKAPDEYNPYEVISASEQGTLAHSLMEYLSDNHMNKDDFIKFAEDVFDEYMKISVPLIKENIENTKKQFLEMMENGWQFDNDNKRKVAFKEEDKETLHIESGITIHGFPDRVEYTSDGKAVIIDFKTEHKLNKHKKDDIDSCLQVLIYAYIVEKEMKVEIDHCEYRMLRYPNGIITCKYDDEIKEALTTKLKEFKTAIDSFDYHIDPFSEKEEKEKCKYCKFGSICGKVVTKDE